MNNGAANGAVQPSGGSEQKSVLKRLSKAFRSKGGRHHTTPVAQIPPSDAFRYDGGYRRSSAPALHNMAPCASVPSLDQGGQWAEMLKPPSDGQWHLRHSHSFHSLPAADAAGLENSPQYDRSFSDRMSWDVTTIGSNRGFTSGSPSFADRTPSWTSYMTSTPRNGPASNCSTPRLSADAAWLAQQSSYAAIGGSPMGVAQQHYVNGLAASGAQGASASTHGGCEVFYMYSSPLNHPPIDVRSEVELLSEAIADSRANVHLNVGAATAGSLTKLLTLAHSRRGLVLHLSAHADYDPERGVGLVLEDVRGVSHTLWREDLEQLLGLRERGLRNISLLFLSTCWSEELAQIFVECGCRHVVAIRQKVHDASARRFSQQFYLSLAVGEPLFSAWKNASCALRLESEKQFAKEADYFVLFGQRGAEKATLDVLCGMEESPSGLPEVGLHIRDFEDLGVFFGAKLPPRPENFVGRLSCINELLGVFSGPKGRRACAVSGPEGIGKSALGIEFAHFATAPGRLFSCSAMIVNLESRDLDGIISAVEDKLETLAAHLRVPVRTMSGMSRGSSASNGFSEFSSRPGSAGSASVCSESLHSIDSSAEGDALSYLLPARQRIRRGFQQLEKCRRKILLIFDDEAGAISGSSEVRKLMGDLLEHTDHLKILVLSREPVYKTLGNTKVANMPLEGLKREDATRLFLQRIHRPLEARDFRPPFCSGGLDRNGSELPLPFGAVPSGPGDPVGGSCRVGTCRPQSPQSPRAQAAAKLFAAWVEADRPGLDLNTFAMSALRHATHLTPRQQVTRQHLDAETTRQLCGHPGHPLLRRLESSPGLICAVGSRVTPNGPSLYELAAQSDLDLVSSPVAAQNLPREDPTDRKSVV